MIRIRIRILMTIMRKHRIMRITTLMMITTMRMRKMEMRKRTMMKIILQTIKRMRILK